MIIGVIYRPPNSDMGAFIEKLNELTESLKTERKVCYLLGDFNINLLNYETHAQTGSFFDMLSSNGFLPLITRPTRVTATSATLIDNIFTNNLIYISSSFQGLLVTDITDHYPVFHIDRQTYMKEAEVFVYKRLFSSKHKNDFYHALSVTDWNEIYRASDTQCAYDLFHDHLLELYNKHLPKIRTKKKYNNRKPWLSEALKNSIRHKNKLYLKYKKVRSAFNEDCYKKKSIRANCNIYLKWLKSNIFMT